MSHILTRDQTGQVFGWDSAGDIPHDHVPLTPSEIEAHVNPAPSIEQLRAALLAELAAIDAASARPLRAILVGSAPDEDRARLTELDEQAAALRVELAALDAPTEPEAPPAEA